MWVLLLIRFNERMIDHEGKLLSSYQGGKTTLNNLLTIGARYRLTKLMLLQFRKLFPPTKWAEEFNASLTVPFFHWLVGPSEVIMLPTFLNNSLTCIAQAQRGIF
jgi:hypothetical protein